MGSPSDTGPACPRALIVDDDALVRRLCRRALEGEGFAIEEAEDGLQAIGLLGRREYDLVLTDHRMPHADGTDVLRAAQVLRPAARRVLMSGTLDPQLESVARTLAHGVFEKTGQLDEFTRRVRQHSRPVEALVEA